MNAKKLPLLCLLLLAYTIAAAQDTGQICIQAFEDRNGNGTRDEDDPPIAQGIAASLMNALSIIIDTQLLENSISAARGLTCFDNLPAGDYIVVLTSAQYETTTPPSFNALVVPGAAPALYNLGLAPIRSERDISSSPETTLSETEISALQWLATALAGGALVAGVVFLLGLSLYFGFFRRRLRKKRQARLQQAQQPGPQPAPSEQKPFAPPFASAPPNDPLNMHQGSPQLFDQDDTSPLA